MEEEPNIRLDGWSMFKYWCKNNTFESFPVPESIVSSWLMHLTKHDIFHSVKLMLKLFERTINTHLLYMVQSYETDLNVYSMIKDEMIPIWFINFDKSVPRSELELFSRCVDLSLKISKVFDIPTKDIVSWVYECFKHIYTALVIGDNWYIVFVNRLLNHKMFFIDTK